MSSGSFSHRRWRTPAHLLAGASLLFAALFSFIPLATTSANAADISCSEVVASDVITIASACPNVPTNVSVRASDHGIEVEWDAALVETTQDNNAPTSFEVTVTPGDVVVKVTAPARSASISGLINGKEYEVSVIARNDFGASDVAGPFLVTPTSGVDGVVGQLIVKYNDGVDATEEEGIATGSESVEGLELTPLTDLGNGVHTVEISEAVSNEQATEIIDALEADPRVAWAETDDILTTSEVPDPEYAPRQWNLWSDFGVEKLLPAGTEGQGVVVAVVDSGSTVHADMPQPVLEGYDFVSDRSELAAPRGVDGGVVSFDGDYVDSEKFGAPGWDNNPADPGDWRDVAPVRTSSWHGTHVAGMIGAQLNNGLGIAGVAPAASILPIRALSWNGGLSSDVAAGIIWASGGHVSGVPDNTNVARVINLSISSRSQCSETLQSAIDMATANGSVVVVAAGNANSDVRDYSPANCNNVIAVGATDATGERAVYSNFGEGVDVYAPGGDLNASGDLGIYSLSNAGLREPAAESYAYRQGTSMAAAHVSGVVARMLSATPTLSVSELRSELQLRSAPRTTPPTACTPDGTSTCIDPVVELAAAPSSPLGLVVNAGVRSVSMKWTPSADTTVTGVRVQWGTSPTALTNQFTIAGRTTQSFVHSGSPVRVLNKSLTSNVATLTTDVAHGLAVGDSVFVSGVDSTFDGTYVVKSRTLTTFTYDRIATNVTAVALTTAGAAQRSQSLAIGQTYYYQIAYIYTDNAQSCTTACISAFSSVVSAQTKFLASTNFAHTGAVQTYRVPEGVTSVFLDAVGAAGGSTATIAGGLGGRVQGSIPTIPGELLFVFVGGTSGTNAVGWNGGGAGTAPGKGGGGATDIRRGYEVIKASMSGTTATLTTFYSHGFAVGNAIVVAGIGATYDGTYTVTAVPTTKTLTFTKTGGVTTSETTVSGAVIQTTLQLERRILVAGGGGGAGSHAKAGSGGQLVGETATGWGVAGAVGGTQSTGNALAVGGNGTTNAGGGGGGYWGGRGGAAYGGGGGGSSYVDAGVFGVVHTQAYSLATGNGSLKISLPQAATMPTPTSLAGTGWSRTSELTWATPGVDDVTGYRVKWGTDPLNIVYQFDVAGGATTSFTHSGTPIAISSKAMTTTVATLTTSVDHGLSVGQEVAITGVDSTFNGTYLVTSVPTTKTFTYALSGTAVTTTAVTPTGLVQRTNNLILGQNYYYKIAALYTDATQSCGTFCLSSFTTTSTVVGRYGVQTAFSFNDGTHTYKVPAGVTQIQVDAQGALGAHVTTYTGGKGGRVQASVPVTPGETLFIYVGGAGGNHFPFTYKENTVGGRNGGGTGTQGGGGGATDIRRGFTVTNAVLTNNVVTLTTSVAHGFAVNNFVVVAGLGTAYDGSYILTAVTANTFSYAKTNANVAAAAVDGAVYYLNPASGLSRRILVAGGGGGATQWASGGAGGGLVAIDGGAHGSNARGAAGTQSTGNALGLGGAGVSSAGGGGGGYWGGNGGSQYGGGGGGSSWTASNIVFARHTQGFRNGDGQLTIATAQSSSISTPTELAVLGGGRQNDVSWAASTNTETTGYRIKWGTSSGALTNIIDVAGGNTNEYLHTGLAMGTRYFYSVAARFTDMNSACQTLCLSDFSSEVSETTRFSATSTFDFTETIQSYRVPAGVTQIRVDAQGGKGGQSGTAVGGLGGRVQATLAVTPGEILFAFVGGGGGDNHPAKYQALITGGWNGGGAGIGVGGGGGGATDLRRGTTVTNAALTSSVAVLTTSTPHGLVVGNSLVVAGVGAPYDGTFTATAVTANTVSFALVNVDVSAASVNGALIRNATNVGLSHRLFVAGGGGGTGHGAGTGGAGGGLAAGEGSSNSCSGGITGNCSGLGATQTYGNALGIGGAGAGTNAGGGGAGYFGGYGSGQNPQQWRYGSAGYSGGGGGSSWTQSSARFVTHTRGFKSGNGALVIYAPQSGSLDAPRNFEVYGYQAYNLLNWTPSTESAVTGYRIAWGTSQGVLSEFTDIPGRLTQSFLHHGNNFAVANKSITTNVATLTTTASHGIAVGNEFIVQGVGSPFDGTYVATTGTTGTTLKYSRVNANIATAVVAPTGNVSKTKSLTINSTYYYEISALYADASRACNTSCESSSSSQRYATPIFTRDVVFSSSGNVQTFTVPDGVTWLQVDALGAGGGTGSTGLGGRGGRTQGVIPVTPGEVLYLYVGGRGGGSLVATQNVGGWNGGGGGQAAGYGGGGGGATDIRRNKLVVTNKIVQSSVATLTTAETHGLVVGNTVIVSGVGAEFDGSFTVTAVNAVNKTLSYMVTTSTYAGRVASGTVSGPSAFATAASLATRVVVAGGGGGGGNNMAGGVGGGLTAGQGGSNSCAGGVTGNCSGLGGSQTYGSSLGRGGIAIQAYSGGGGGGYWGGWAAGNTPQLDRTGTGGYSGGGGGSSYTAAEVLSATDLRTIAGVMHTQGFNAEDGSLTLTVPTRAYPTGVDASGWTGYNTISWDPSDISGVTQYRVYGGTSQNPSTLLATLPTGTTSFDHHGSTFVVTSKNLTSNVVTLTTSTTHGITANSKIIVSGIDPLWDGLRTVTAATSTTLSFAFSATNVATASVSAGTVQLQNGLTLGTPYFYRVSIVTGAIESQKSTEVTATPSFSSAQTFAAIGDVQQYTVPVNVNKIFIDAYGAQGAIGATGLGGKGGRTQGVIPVTPGEVLYLYVGGKGGEYLASSMNLGGWNGGGGGQAAGYGGGGGGATDIRRNKLVVTNKIVQSSVATLTTAETHGLVVGNTVIVSGVGEEFDGSFTVTAVNAVNKTLSYMVTTSTYAGRVASGTVSGPSAFATAASLATRVVVAGGGGGGGNNMAGGVGGGLTAGEGRSHSCAGGVTGHCSGLGGSQTYGRSLGLGGVGVQAYSGGGGGGYWGGWAAGNTPQLDRTGTGGYSGGGGGSSYTATEVTAVLHAQGVNEGNGLMTISWSASPTVTGVQATALNAAVTVSWNESTLSGLSGYRVYGGTTPNPTTLLSTVSATTLGYTHTGLTNETTYYYRVTAIVTANGRSNETPASGDVAGVPTTLITNNYAANGAVQIFPVPAGVSWLQVDAIGAQGGTGASGLGGKGGRLQGAIPVTPGETLYLYVGGNGVSNTGGWNGGGGGQAAGYGGGGGGATDIRRNKLVVTNKIVQSSVATLTTAETHGLVVGNTVIVSGVGEEFDGSFTVTAVNAVNKTLSYMVATSTYAGRVASGTVSGPSAFATAASLATRVVVAGGGGGGGNNMAGGVGGGLTAGQGGSNSCAGGVTGNCSGLGGSQTYGSSLGRGGIAIQAYSGGGGGGYWGGWAAGNTPQLDRTGTGGYSGGGGGSSYTATEVAMPIHTQGYQTGAGSLSLSYSVDTTAPVVTGVSSPNPTGNYIIGKEISINVSYSEAVVVTGTPTLTLDAGTRDVVLNYVSGSGSSTLLFNYVVANGDLKNQLDIKATNSLDVAGGVITDRAGNAADNTLPVPGSATSLVGSKLLSIDGVPPVKPLVLSASGVDGISLDWADNTETDLREYRIYSCSGLIAASCSSAASFSSLSSVAAGTSTFDHIAVGRGITYYYYVTAIDLRGNEGPASDVVSWYLPVPVMVATPSVTAVSPTSDRTPEVTGVADAGATVYVYMDGSTTPLGSVTASNTGTYSFSPPSNISAGLHTFRARAVVAGVKTGSSGYSNEQSVVIDITAPVFTSNNRSFPTTQTTGLDSLTFRWTFSEAVSGLDASDIAVSGSTASVTRIAMVSGSTGDYDVTISGGDLAGYNGVVGVSFISSPTVTDIAGNALAGITSTSAAQTYTMDNSNPVVTITSSAATLGGTSTATLTFTLGQASTDFVSGDVDVTGGTLSAFAGSGTTYTATFTPRSGFSGTATIAVDAGSFSNASGVYNAAGSVSITIDTTAPNVLSIQSTTANGIYKVGAIVNIAVTFDEAIAVATGGGVPTLLLETGAVDRTATFVSSTGAVATFRYVVQTGDASNDLDVQSAAALVLNGGAIRDAAGNAANITVVAPGSSGSLGANAAIVVDTIAPVAPSSLSAIGVGGVTAANKLSATNTDLTATATIVAADATGGVATLYLDGVAIATDNTIASGDTSVHFVLGKTTTAELQAAIPLGGVLTAKLADVAGNVSGASTSVTLVSDYVVPTIQLSSSRSTLIAGQTATITATLSEASLNFTNIDVSATGGLVSGFTGSGTSYSFTFTPTSSSTTPMSVQVLAGVFSDAVGNQNTASAVLTAVVDTVIPTVSSVSSPTANGSYRAGATIDVAVTFSKVVVVTTSAGSPTLLLETGTQDRLATYSSGSGTSVLTFRYVVQAGDASNDLDAQSNAALALNGGFIKDASGNDAVLTLASPGATGSLGAAKAIVIDTVAPAAPTGVVVTPAGGVVVANTLLANNTNMTASATVVAGQATGGSAELVLGSTTIATDTSIAAGDSSVNFNLNFAAAADLQAAIAAGGQLTVRLIDAAGNVSLASAAVNLTVDYVKPTATLSTSRSALKIGETATITVQLSEASSNFILTDVTVTGGTLGTFVVVSPTQYSFVFTPASATNAGSASLSIATGAFTDAAGNTSAASASLPMSFDTSAPAVPTVTGSSPVLTNDATPTLSGTAEVGSTVVVRDTSPTPATVLATLVAVDGTWSFDAATLSEGNHSIVATATDAAGNTSASSTAKTWQIDTTPPTVSLSTVAGNDIVTRSEKDAGVAVSGIVEAGASVVLEFAGLSKTLTPASGAWTYSISASDWTVIGATSPVAFTVTATDSATNTASRTRSVTMNLASIAVPGDPDLLAVDDTANPSDNITTNGTIRIDVPLLNAATPSHEVGQLLQLIDSAGGVLASRVLDAADIAAGTYQFTLQDLSDDTYAMQSRASGSGNSSVSTGTLVVTVDNRVPGAPGAPNMTDASDTGISARDNVTMVGQPVFRIAINGLEISGNALVVGDSIILYNGNTSVHTLTLSSTDLSAGFVLLQPDSNLPEGTNVLTAKAQSNAGTLGPASSALSIVVDTTPQSAPLAPDLIALDDTGASSSDDITSVTQPNFVVVFSGLGVVANDQVELLDGSLQVIGTATISSIDVANGSVNVAPSGSFTDGINLVKARIIDRAGNTGTASASVSIRISTNIPNATTPVLQTASDTGQSSSDRITQRSTPTFTGVGTSGDTVKLYNGSTLLGTSVVASGTWSITVASLADNTYTLRALVTDNAGNESSFSSGLGVTIDTSRPVAPSITGSPLLKNTSTPSVSGTAEAFAVVNVYEDLHLIGTTTADGLGNWTLTSSSLSDQNYSLKASATDMAGNTSTDSATVNMLVDTVTPSAPTINAVTTYAITQALSGSGEPGATLTIYDGAISIGAVTVGGGGTWSFTTTALTNSTHSFTAIQADAVGNTSVASSPARTIPAIQMAALYGANGADDDGMQASASQYGAGGITDIDTAAKASLINDVIDTLANTAVDTQAEIAALAVIVKSIFATAAGEIVVPALTPQDLAVLGITGVDTENITAVIAAIAGTADNGSGIDSLSELGTLVDATLAASRASLTIISSYDGSNTTPSEADFNTISVTGVSAANISAINTVVASLVSSATDSRAEVQAIVDTYVAILNGADGIANSGLTLSAAQFQNIGLADIANTAQANLLNSIIDASATSEVDSLAELQVLANIVARLGVTAAGGNATPALTPAELALIGIAGVTASNLSSVLASIATTDDSGSGIDSFAKLQGAVDTGIANARDASQSIISSHSGSNATPTLADFENIGVTGVSSANITAVNTFIAVMPASDTDAQPEVQALVDAYAKVLTSANGVADGGASLSAAEFAALGLLTVDAGGEVSLLNDLIDRQATTAVDSYSELAAMASLVTRLMSEAAGVAASPALTASDLAALGITGVTAGNLAEVLAVIRGSADDGSAIDTMSELQTLVTAAVVLSRQNALDIISRYDGTSATTTPTLANYANAEVSGALASNLTSLNSAFAEITETDSNTTASIQGVVTGYIAILQGADGQSDGDISLVASDYLAMNLKRVDTAGKATLLNEIFDGSATSQVDTYSELQAISDVVADIFLVSTGAQAQLPLTAARLALIGISGATSDNIALLIAAIANTSDDTLGVDSLTEIQAIANQVRTSQESALAVISAYDGANAEPLQSTFDAAGIVGVDSSNIGIINQFLAVMSAESTDSFAEVQALVDAVNKLMICADGTANNNCVFTATEFQAMGYLDIDTQEEVDALNADLDVLDLAPNQESRVTSEAVRLVVDRFRPRPVLVPAPTTTAPAAPTTTVPTTSAPAPSPTTSVPEVVPTSTTVVAPIPTPTTVPVPTTVPEIEVLPGSGGVQMAPDKAQVLIDGKLIDLIVVINDDNSATIELPGQFVVRVIPTLPEDSVVLSDGSTGLRVYRNRTISIQGEGFAKESEVEVWMNSTPIKLGTAMTDTNGAFSESFTTPLGIELGEHTLTLSGNLPDGTLSKTSIGLIVVDAENAPVAPTDKDKKPTSNSSSSEGGAGAQGPGGAPYDPQSEPKAVVGLLGDMVGLLALAGMAVAGRRREDDDDGSDSGDKDDRGSGDISDVTVKHHSSAADVKKDILRLPRSSFVDRIVTALPMKLARVSPLVGRVLTDGTYLRSLLGVAWLLLPLLGVVVGVGSAVSTDFNAVMPSLAWLTAVVIIGSFDALAGFMAASVFGVLVVLGGGIHSSDSVRGLLGIWVFSFAVPMLASASRPFRRKDAVGLVGAWDRAADFVMIVLFGAWAAGSMFGSLPGLTGFRPSYADDVLRIQVIVLVVLVLRYALENATTVLTPGKLRELSASSLPDPSNTQIIISSLIRTTSFVFVAIVFIGNNWALWTGAALYLLPKLVAIIDDKFPNVEALHRYMPRGILKVTFMMFVARWWGQLLTSNIDDAEKMLTFGFVFLGMPGFITTVLGWFGRSSSKPWKPNWFTRFGGLVVLVVGFLIVRGVILG